MAHGQTQAQAIVMLKKSLFFAQLLDSSLADQQYCAVKDSQIVATGSLFELEDADADFIGITFEEDMGYPKSSLGDLVCLILKESPFKSILQNWARDTLTAQNQIFVDAQDEILPDLDHVAYVLSPSSNKTLILHGEQHSAAIKLKKVDLASEMTKLGVLKNTLPELFKQADETQTKKVAQNSSKARLKRSNTLVSNCSELIRSLLQKNSVASKELETKVLSAGFTLATYRRARKMHNIKTQKIKGIWLCTL